MLPRTHSILFVSSALGLTLCTAGCGDDGQGGNLFGGESADGGISSSADDGDDGADGGDGDADADSGDDASGDGDGDADDDGGTSPKFDVSSPDGGSGNDDGGQAEKGCTKVDLLFVVDDSASMYDEQDKLTDAFPSFMETIDQELVQNKGIDYHVGVVSAEMAGSSMCLFGNLLCADGFRGRLNHEQDRISCAADEPPGRWIETGPVDTVAKQFTCIASMEGQDFREMPLEAMRAALIDRHTDTEMYNSGFSRSDALLVVVLLTDENDQSVYQTPETWNVIDLRPNDPVEDFWDAVVDHKGGDPNRVVVVGISGERNADCGGTTEEPDATSAERIHEFLDLAAPNSYWTSLCGTDYVQPLQEALAVISASCEEFIPPAG